MSAPRSRATHRVRNVGWLCLQGLVAAALHLWTIRWLARPLGWSGGRRSSRGHADPRTASSPVSAREAAERPAGAGPIFLGPAPVRNGSAAPGEGAAGTTAPPGEALAPAPAEAGAPAAPPDELREEAKRHPSSWVYEIDPTFTGPGAPPVERIVRAWRTDAEGAILAHTLVENPYHRPAERTASARGRRRRAVVLLGVVLVVLAAGAVVYLVANRASSPHHAPAAAISPRTAASTPARPPAVSTPATPPVIATTTSPPQAHGSGRSTPSAPRPAAAARKHAAGARTHRPPTPPPVAHLSVVATGRVWVCVVDASGRPVINGVVLLPGQTSPVLVSPQFRVYTGNDAVELRVGGVTHAVASGAHPAYLVRPGSVTPLSSSITEPCP